jgi:hypothetical protein
MAIRITASTTLLLLSSATAGAQQARPPRLIVDEKVLADEVVVTAATRHEEPGDREIANMIVSPPVSPAAVNDGLVTGFSVDPEDQQSVERVEAELARATRTAQVDRR